MLRLGPTQLSKYLGISRQSIYRAEKSGHITRGSDGKFDPEQVRQDWRESTPLKMGGIHSRLKDAPAEPDLTTPHPALDILQQAWGISLRSMALCLRELDTFDEKDRHFGCLSIMFLLQWRIVGEELGYPWDQWESQLKMTGDMATLIREGRKGVKAGAIELEEWLKKESRIDFQKDY